MATSVLPTPVGPRKRKEAIGLSVFLNSILARLKAEATSLTASSWPIILWCIFTSKFKSFLVSSMPICVTGILVKLETTSATSSPVTTDFSPRRSLTVSATSSKILIAFSGKYSSWMYLLESLTVSSIA